MYYAMMGEPWSGDLSPWLRQPDDREIVLGFDH